MPLIRPRPRGSAEQHGRRPFRARSRGCSCTSRTRRFRLVVSDEAVGRSRVVQVVFMAARAGAVGYLLHLKLSCGNLPGCQNRQILVAPYGPAALPLRCQHRLRRGREAVLVASLAEPIERESGRGHKSLPSCQVRPEATVEW